MGCSSGSSAMGRTLALPLDKDVSIAARSFGVARRGVEGWRSKSPARLPLRLFDITSDVGGGLLRSSPQADGHEQIGSTSTFQAAWMHPSRRAPPFARSPGGAERLTSITGARDDFDPNLYGVKSKSDLTAYLRADPLHRSKMEETPRDPAENLLFILERLRATGVGSVIVVPLDAGIPGFAVAKVLAPELEHPPGERQKSYGRRALKLMMAAAR